MNLKITGVIALLFVMTSSCTGVSKEERGQELYQMHCARSISRPTSMTFQKSFGPMLFYQKWLPEWE